MEPWKENILLDRYTSIGIGGPARYFVEVRTVDQMKETLKLCRDQRLSFFVLGKGSNCIFDDRGYNGLVILNRIAFCEMESEGVFHVGAGFNFSQLGARTARQSWSGLEFASGIPGSVGGAVYMNAGANGRETADSLIEVEYLHADGTVTVYDCKNLNYSYRKSPFQDLSGVILSAKFQLTYDSEARNRQIAIVEKRKETQPLQEASAGCMFRNPDLAAAGALIEKAGLKGVHVGDAQVSMVHANFLINAGAASSKEMGRLVQEIQNRVRDQFSVELKQEVLQIPYEEGFD
ncbi:MAG: UDP-N-acetylenolpyruvoylglucosamine reductase [Waddliaceae bacterium]|nr:UDP-N-acetylenolpyruvoylglucosamine reductase [Waddliaceae bacterium]